MSDDEQYSSIPSARKSDDSPSGEDFHWFAPWNWSSGDLLGWALILYIVSMLIAMLVWHAYRFAEWLSGGA